MGRLVAIGTSILTLLAFILAVIIFPAFFYFAGLVGFIVFWVVLVGCCNTDREGESIVILGFVVLLGLLYATHS